MFDLTGRTVVVTGGNAGIGLGMAEALARAGAAVAVWGRDPAKNEAAEERLRGVGAKAAAIACDVSDEEQVAAAFAATLEQLDGKVDCLFANAGIAGMSKFTDMSLRSWRKVMSVNLDGAFLSLREAARHLVERGEGGSLVAVSSVSAIHGAPRMQHYAASKSALIAVMRGLAVELARHSIRCNTVLPGWIETDMNASVRENDAFMKATTSRTPVGRWGAPDDLGAVAVFLADPSLRFHTGDTVVVDGGYTVF